MSDEVPRLREGLFNNICLTQFKKCMFRFKWTINDFSFYRDASDNKIVSSTFSDGTNDGLKWSLEAIAFKKQRIYEGRYSQDYPCLSLNLQLVSSNLKGSFLNTQCKLSILNSNLTKANEHKYGYKFRDDDGCFSIGNFIKEVDLFKKGGELLPDDGLTILCEINIGESNECILGELAIPDCHLSSNLGHLLLENPELSDITLCAGTKEIQAHKVILAARSNVFSVMFQYDVKEGPINRIDIPDVDFEILEKMLHFIYTDEISDFHKITDLIHLSKVAEKYELERLKLRCEEVLGMNLSDQNAAECYIAADQVNAENLKALTKTFIISNAANVTKTSGFALLVRSYAELVVEALSSIS